MARPTRTDFYDIDSLLTEEEIAIRDAVGDWVDERFLPLVEKAYDATHPGAVKSPMVGTGYLSPEPGAPAFVAVGDRVKEGQTLMLVEAMKTFNEIKSPRAGTVRKILIENQQPVEYGDVLMIID